MKQFKTVFKFELAGLIKNKALLITTGVMMVIALLITSIPSLIGFFAGDEEETNMEETEQVEEYEENFQLVYANEDLERMMADILGEESYASEDELKDAVKNEEIENGYIVEAIDQYKYIAYDRSIDSFEQQEFESQLEMINENYLFEQSGMDREKINEILNTPIEKEEVFLGKDVSGSGTVIAFAIIFIMYMLILLYGNNVATSVAREKDSRTMELLITSTKPKTLILGKVAAVGLTGVLQIASIILAGVIGFFLNKGSYPAVVLELVKDTMSLDTVFVYASFSLLGYLLYLFIYASLGSLVSKVEDVAKSTAPITYLFIIAYLAATMAMNMPDNSIIKVTSFIPFVSMFTMPIRYMMTTVPIYSLLASILIMIATVLLFAAISIYIYRFGSLNYGNRLSLKEVIKSIKRN
ncbi:MAG: ABC transporter permease [Atopostipes suicloacalis]|nr:ABC transporter permease [Atopostipes suicloacalis]MDN6730834.1 ABC transporter permease [Atopostipes suicloacalis]